MPVPGHLADHRPGPPTARAGDPCNGGRPLLGVFHVERNPGVRRRPSRSPDAARPPRNGGGPAGARQAGQRPEAAQLPGASSRGTAAGRRTPSRGGSR